MLSGNSETLLQDNYEIILSERVSERYFGSQNAVGQSVSLRINEKFTDFIVSGILENVPSNSSLKFDFIVNLESIYPNKVGENQQGFPLFILLKDKSFVNQLVAKFPDTIDKELSERFNAKGQYSIHPFNGYHLDENTSSSIFSDKGSYTYMYVLSLIASLILFVACFNYANLSIAIYSQRIKEVGIRKILGAANKQIRNQFLADTLIMSSMALFMGLLLAAIVLPFFSSLVGNNITINYKIDLFSTMFMVLLITLVTLISGLYPSFVFSKIKLIELTKIHFKFSGKNVLSKILIVLQFSVSVILICCTIFLYMQNDYLYGKDLGIKKNNVITVSLNFLSNPQKAKSIYESFKNNLLKYNIITNVAGAKYSLSSSWMTWVTNLRTSGSRFMIDENVVDYNFIPLLNIKLLSGRNFLRDFSSDTRNSVIVNTEFIKQLKIENPLGVEIGKYFEESNYSNMKIIGVVDNFHYQSLKTKIKPMVLRLSDTRDFNFVYISYTGDDQGVIKLLKSEFSKVAPFIPLNYSFINSEIRDQYKDETKWSQLILFASFSAIIIACLGLLGLTILVGEKRTKEFAIRKILGASISNILILINREFVLLVILANLIAWPVVYYLVDLYLQNYPYRINIDYHVFGLVALLTTLISVLTIGSHTYRSANANPIEAIKIE